MQSSRPKSVIAPTMFGLGIEMDHVFGSKWLINELSHLGFSISYDEVERYKQSVIQSETIENLLSEYIPGTFTQWVADNVDHNVVSLDYGNYCCFFSKRCYTITFKATYNSLQRITVNEVVKEAFAFITYKPILHLQSLFTLPPETSSDLLWHTGWLASGAAKTRPNWSGFMQHLFSNETHSKSEVLFVPIIDLNPSNETCIYSTLTYIQSQAEQLNLTTPCVTFDQPLWIKAIEIIKSKSMNMVCRLGGFHMMMSFLGSIGSMMKGSGLEEALERAYGPNAVTHMMTGKAVSRALRGHFLVEVKWLASKLLPLKVRETVMLVICLMQWKCQGVLNLKVMHISEKGIQIAVQEMDKLDCAEVQKICELYQGIQEKSMSIADIAESNELLKLEECLMKYKAILAE